MDAVPRAHMALQTTESQVASAYLRNKVLLGRGKCCSKYNRLHVDENNTPVVVGRPVIIPSRSLHLQENRGHDVSLGFDVDTTLNEFTRYVLRIFHEEANRRNVGSLYQRFTHRVRDLINTRVIVEQDTIDQVRVHLNPILLNMEVIKQAEDLLLQLARQWNIEHQARNRIPELHRLLEERNYANYDALVRWILDVIRHMIPPFMDAV